MRYHCGLARVKAEDFTLHAMRQIAIFRHASDARVGGRQWDFPQHNNNPWHSKNTFIDTALVGVN